MNTEHFLEHQRTYFSGSYDQFCTFGGPCVYFHRECLHAGAESPLSERHIEMLYATLTAWGMHRMGDVERTKTKLTGWETFRESLLQCAGELSVVRGVALLGSTERECADALRALWPVYRRMRLSVSDATIVVNSKALYHLLPDLVMPIDRQYTVRFFTQRPDIWRRGKKFREIALPAGLDRQFELFHEISMKGKRLADRVEPEFFEAELRQHNVTAPKALDNAIVNYVRAHSKGSIQPDA